MAHSRKMFSLSMTTFTTTCQSHQHPSEPLLCSTGGHQGMFLPPPLHPATSYVSGTGLLGESSSAVRAPVAPVLACSLIGHGFLGIVHSRSLCHRLYGLSRQHPSIGGALPWYLLSSLPPFCGGSRSIVCASMPRFPATPIPVQVLTSFAIPRLVLSLRPHHGQSGLGHCLETCLSLPDRCHWNLDVVWVGVGSQCGTHAPAFGVWLTAAIVRLALTAIFLVVCHITSRTYRALRWPPSYCPDDVRRMDSVKISQIMHGCTPLRPSPVIHSFTHKRGGFSSIPQRSLSSSRMAVLPEYSTRNREGEDVSSDSAESSTLSEEGSSSKPGSRTATHTSPRHTSSLRDVRTGEGSSRCAAIPSDAEEGDLRGFADHFRALVNRIFREFEDSRNLEAIPNHPCSLYITFLTRISPT
ncbi:hypothetical protein BC827DRAFT_891480 [Russula dissimulans]|nr:hypothetical protein BC827DRAFT_891480 [Russula dissimulans]